MLNSSPSGEELKHLMYSQTVPKPVPGTVVAPPTSASDVAQHLQLRAVYPQRRIQFARLAPRVAYSGTNQ